MTASSPPLYGRKLKEHPTRIRCVVSPVATHVTCIQCLYIWHTYTLKQLLRRSAIVEASSAMSMIYILDTRTSPAIAKPQSSRQF